MHNATLYTTTSKMVMNTAEADPRHGSVMEFQGHIGDLGLMLPFAMVADMDIRPETRVSLTRLLAQQAQAARGQQEMLSLLQDGRLTRGYLSTAVEGTTDLSSSLPIQGSAFSRLLRGRCAVDGDSFFRVPTCFRFRMTFSTLRDKGREKCGSEDTMVRSVHRWWSTSHVVLGMRNGCFPC